MAFSRPNYPDPDIVFGSFKVLPRTDGGYVVIDTRREPGYKTVRKFSGEHAKRDAAFAAETWHKQGHG